MTLDYAELMSILSHPRPNGSTAERATSRALQAWLAHRNIPFRLHNFRQYPYFFECIGVWLIVSRTLLALAIWLRWGWPALPIAFVGLLGGMLDVAVSWPLVSWFGARRGENILIEFSPPEILKEIIFSAHYDTKTEPLDHRQRMIFVKNLRTGILITILLGLLGPLDHWLLVSGSAWNSITHGFNVFLTIPMLILAWGIGLNLSVGRFLPQSPGAVDNGTACATLLGLADCLRKGELVPQNTKITLAIFTGEEVNMQGSRAYTHSREWPLPALAINLEVLAQDGDYVYWEQEGNSLGVGPTSPETNARIIAAVRAVTGSAPIGGGPINSDGFSFLSAGIPTGILGTYDRHLKDTGFHQPTDNLERVRMARLPEGVEILTALVRHYDIK